METETYYFIYIFTIILRTSRTWNIHKNGKITKQYMSEIKKVQGIRQGWVFLKVKKQQKQQQQKQIQDLNFKSVIQFGAIHRIFQIKLGVFPNYWKLNNESDNCPLTSQLPHTTKWKHIGIGNFIEV